MNSKELYYWRLLDLKYARPEEKGLRYKIKKTCGKWGYLRFKNWPL